jgi:hypothetical protein
LQLNPVHPRHLHVDDQVRCLADGVRGLWLASCRLRCGALLGEWLYTPSLDKAVAAVKVDKAKALDMFIKVEDGFKDRDLYVFCANASDGIIPAQPTHKGEQLADIKGKKSFPLGQEMMQKATEGTINEVTYWWPRPGSDKPLVKRIQLLGTPRPTSSAATTSSRLRSTDLTSERG